MRTARPALLFGAVKLLKKLGISTKQLLVPYYWLPYNFGRGLALPPISVNMEFTFRCNLRCQMCSLVVSNAVVTGGYPLNRGGVDDDIEAVRGKELEVADYLALLDELRDFGVRRVNFTGGEPLIKKGAPDILRRAARNGFHVSMISNGTVMTDDVCDALMGVDSMTISVDGPEAIHNEIRGSDTGFQRIRQNVKKLSEWKRKVGSDKPAIQFSCAVSSLNQAHVSQVVDFARECGIKSVNYGYLFFNDEEATKETEQFALTGQADFCDQRIPMHLREVNFDTMKQELREARRKAGEMGIQLSFNPPLEEDEIEERFTSPLYFYTNKCFVPWYETRVNPFGDVYSCQIDTLLGNIREQAFRKIWNAQPYREFRALIREHKLLAKCSRCCKLNDRMWNVLPRIGFFPKKGQKAPAQPLGSNRRLPVLPS